MQNWNKSFENIYRTTADNKLREFNFKLLHRILVINKEPKRFQIKNEDLGSQRCQCADSLEHTFLDCPVSIKFYGEIISWFNQKNKTKITLTNEEFLFQNYELPSSLPSRLRCLPPLTYWLPAPFNVLVISGSQYPIFICYKFI